MLSRTSLSIHVFLVFFLSYLFPPFFFHFLYFFFFGREGGREKWMAHLTVLHRTLIFIPCMLFIFLHLLRTHVFFPVCFHDYTVGLLYTGNLTFFSIPTTFILRLSCSFLSLMAFISLITLGIHHCFKFTLRYHTYSFPLSIRYIFFFSAVHSPNS